MYKCILIPTDGTEFCKRAIQHGVTLAKSEQATVVSALLQFDKWRPVE